jgi:small-conductance mechanosensitive channel
VVLDGEILFYIRTQAGPYPPEERAEAAVERLQRLADDPFYDSDLFSIQEEGDRAIIQYQKALLGAVTNEDAAAEGKSPMTLAKQWVRAAKRGIDLYRERRGPRERLYSVLIVSISTAALILLIFLLRRFRRWARTGLSGTRWHIPEVRFQKAILIPPERMAAALLKVMNVLHWMLVVLLVIIYLQIDFSAIPLTRGFAEAVLDYVTTPLRTLWASFLDNIGNFFFIIVVAVLVRYLLKIIRWVFRGIAEGSIQIPSIKPSWAMTLYKLVKLAVLAIAAIIVYPYIPGSDSLAFKGLSVFAGAILTLGSSSQIGNFLSGLVLMSMRAYDVGDRVTISGVTGDVVETSLLLTRVRTIKDEVVTIPSGAVLGGPLVNFSALSRRDGLQIHTAVTIGYDAPWRQVHELLIRAALRTPDVKKEPAPYVLQTALNDFYVTYEINAYVADANRMHLTYGALHQNIQDSFNEAGVEIMSPHFASLRDGNQIAIPESYRSPGPGRAFRVKMEDAGPVPGNSSPPPENT